MKKIIFVMIVFISIIPAFTKNAFGLCEYLKFVLAYFIGGYIRLYLNEKINKKVVITIILVDVSALISICISMIMVGYLLHNQRLIEKSSYFIGTNYSIFIVILSTCIFLLFKDFNIKNNKYINNIASSVLGVYLIHDNYFIRPLIWTKIYPNNNYFTEWYFFMFAIIKILCVFIICVIIDTLRNICFKKIKSFLVDRIYNLVTIIYYFSYNNFNRIIQKIEQ